MAEPTVNQLVATTLNNYHKQFADNVSNSNAVTALLREGNRVRVIEGGRVDRLPADLRRGNLRVVHRDRAAVPRHQGNDFRGALRSGQRRRVRHALGPRSGEEPLARAHPQSA